MMSKKLGWCLFSILFFGLFALAQFEAESRRQRMTLEGRIEQLELKLASFIQEIEDNDPKRELSNVNVSQQQLEDKVQKDTKTVTELLELLVAKDEKFTRELNQLKEQLGAEHHKSTPPASH